jgi:hypothetical protein
MVLFFGRLIWSKITTKLGKNYGLSDILDGKTTSR